MSPLSPPSSSDRSRRWPIAFWTALVVVFVMASFAQWSRWSDPTGEGMLVGWWSGLSPDWLPFLPVLILAIPCWFWRRPLVSRAPGWWFKMHGWGGESCPTANRPSTTTADARAYLLSVLVAVAGFVMGQHIAHQFGDLPPAYHDEFSYLFQTNTFLAGQTSFPSHPETPELFDQMHVLNEGRFASRYFPGAGLWMLPFLAMGNVWLGQRVAHSLASFLLFWIGRHLGNNVVGLVAGLLLAMSPGVGLFSNLLLAHHPTLVGLLVFTITFLKLRQAIRDGGRLGPWALLAGCGLTFAMLCRPMTAAGVGLPFGIWFGWWVLTGRMPTERNDEDHSEDVTPRTWPAGRRWRTAVMMGLPIVVGFAGLFAYSHTITGHALVTPYQQYTDIYTPRHVYGFNNVVRGEQRLGPKVIEEYDSWAENLTPSLAARNVGRRITASLKWTLGIVPLALAGLVFLLTIDRWSRDWWLMAAAIVSLHAAHIPYWFEGIMGWHYVFESAPYWLLIFAGASQRLWQNWRASDRGLMPVWWCGLTLTAVVVNTVTIEPFWPARLDVGIAEVAYPRKQYAAFQQLIEKLTDGRCALILIESNDRHIDYVVNDPTLDARVLYGRYRPGVTDESRVVQAFPDRDIWWLVPGTDRVRLVSRKTTAN